MRKISALIVIALVLGMLGMTTGNVSASGKFPSYISSIQLQNLSSEAATVTLTYYLSDGTVDTSFVDPDVLSGYGTRTYFPTHANSGFSGSVVVSSDKPLAAVSNILGLGSSKTGAGAYVALTDGSTSIALPLLMKGNSNIDTWFSVQNIDSGDATVNVSYSDGTTAGPVTIPAGSSHVFDQSTETHSAKVFAGSVTADKKIAAVVLEETSTNVIYAYTGFMAGTTNPVMPLINSNNNGVFTGVQVQNAGTETTEVTLSYTHSMAGNDCTETQTIGPGASATFALYSFGGNALSGMTTTCVMERFIGSAKVTTNSTSMPLMVVVNQLTPTGGEAYGGFDVAGATDTIVFPLLMDRNSGWWTSINMMNVGTEPTTINCTFTNTSYTFSATLDPGEPVVTFQGDNIAEKWVGSGTCVSTNSVPIVGVVNEANGSATFDGLLVYEGINIH